MEQAADFLEECAALQGLLAGIKEADLLQPTLFKDWTFADIIRHLAVWDRAARLTLDDADGFTAFFAPVPKYMAKNDLRSFEQAVLPLTGLALVDDWWNGAQITAQRYATADPKRRLRWGGPDLSARSCITSRLMETWSHSQAIYDELDVERIERDRIKNVAQIGVQTFGWTFANRGRTPPGPIPSIELTAPSGAIWRWENSDSDNLISGTAVDFCRVVTQVRNIADTDLNVQGSVAREWMRIAQCFAGLPTDPPAVGVRRRKSSPAPH